MLTSEMSGIVFFTIQINRHRITKKVGGTIDDTELVDGLVFSQHIMHNAGGPTRVTNAKIGLIQFCLSAPKTNVLLNSRFFLNH